jgi:flagellar protein FlaG
VNKQGGNINMDVNSIGQNTNNINAYSTNVSEYSKSNTEAVVPQVQQTEYQAPKIESRVSEDNNAKKQEYSKKDVEDAVKKINNFLKDDKTHAEYTYNEEMKTMMIKVVDEKTKEVILEVPPKKILDMVASMLKSGRSLLGI